MQPPQKSRRLIWLRAIGTLSALALLLYLLSQQGWHDISQAIVQIAPWRLALAMVLMLLSRLAVASRWHVLLRAGKVDISASQSFRITFAGLFASNFLPTTIGGDVIRLAGALQLRCDGVVSTASLIADRLVGIAGMAMALPLGLPRLIHGTQLQGLSPQLFPLGLAAFFPPVLKTWMLKIWLRAKGLFGSLLAALSLWAKQPGGFLLALTFSWVHMLCTFGVLTLFLQGMGEPLSFWLIGGLYSLVYFITLFPISINGYGLQELSMTYVFIQWGGVALSHSLSAALLFRTLVMLGSLPGALFIPGLLAYSRQKDLSITAAADSE